MTLEWIGKPNLPLPGNGLPAELMQVLSRGLEIGQASNGAFDIGLGDLILAWGFGPSDADTGVIRANLGRERCPTHEVLDLDRQNLRARKLAPFALDLSDIAKGFGVDRMMQVCDEYAIPSALLSLDGELRSKGRQVDGKPWTVIIEKPDHDVRLPLSVLELQDAAVATSGDYRHWVEVGQTRFRTRWTAACPAVVCLHSPVGVDVYFAPKATLGVAMLACIPLAFTLCLDPVAIH